MTRTLANAAARAADDGFALRTANPADRVALRGVRLLARLSGMSQRVTLEQTFVNLEPRAIEAVYTFPLPESAAVCGFEVVTADRVLTGAVEEAEAATERYEDAVADGHGAFLVEQDRPDVFTVRVGNLKPRQAATIRLTYVAPLERVDKQIRVAFPTTVAPRYATATATDPIDAAVDADALNPPHVLTVPYGLTMRLEVDIGRELVGCFSPSHGIDVSHEADGRAVVSLAAGVTEMNRDVVLSLRLAREQQPHVQAAAGPDGATYLAVTFVPEFDEAELGEVPAGETVFVLDCSGSMMGESIDQAQAALELCLRSLSPGDTFNVCRFGSTFELLASEPLPYTQATLDRALRYVRQSADLGGTELHAPLEAILSTPPRAGVVRQVILLTDGQVTNEPAVVELARQHRRHNRVFSFGIGAACSAFLVKGVARATGGAAEFISAGERIDEKVLRTFARLTSPIVGDVTLDWDEAEVQTLAEIPPVFDGDVLAVFGRCAGGRLPRHVTLSCQVGGGAQSWQVQVPPRRADENVIATLWARRTIQSLEEVNGPALVRSRKREPTREQETLVRLSKQFNLLCGLTTFVAVEHRSEAERNEGRPAVRRVPVQIAKEWGGLDAMQASLIDRSMASGGGAFRSGPVAGQRMMMPAPAASPPAAKKQSRGLLGKLFGGGGGAAADDGPRPPMSGAPVGGTADFDAEGDSGLLDLTRESDDSRIGAVFDEISPAAPLPSARNAIRPGRSLDLSLDKTLDRSVDKAAADGKYDPAEAPIQRLIDGILQDAVRGGAVEVRFEPLVHVVEVRFLIGDQWVMHDLIPRKMRLPIARAFGKRVGIDPYASDQASGSFTTVIDRVTVGVTVEYATMPLGRAITLRLDPAAVVSVLAGAAPPFVPTDQDLLALLGLQSAEGWFGWNDRAAEMVYADGRGWKAAVEADLPGTVGAATRQQVVHTVLVLLLLSARFADRSDLWKRAATKATRQFLAKALGNSPAEAEAWVAGLRATGGRAVTAGPRDRPWKREVARPGSAPTGRDSGSPG